MPSLKRSKIEIAQNHFYFQLSIASNHGHDHDAGKLFENFEDQFDGKFQMTSSTSKKTLGKRRDPKRVFNLINILIE